MSAQATSRTSVQLYRDCLRLAKHVGGQSSKARSIKSLIRQEFEKSRNETDPEKIVNLKANAIRGLSNYLVYANSGHDSVLQSAMKSSQDESIINDAEWKPIDSDSKQT